MAPDLSPSVEKYERILQADPRSRIFVELARALLEGGDASRALEVCERGLAHHRDSVQARVVAGKALLALGRGDEALARFTEAVAADPANPYAYDLAGEALVKAGLGTLALPLLGRGASQHPGDARLQRWLAEARRLAKAEAEERGATTTATAAAGEAATATSAWIVTSPATATPPPSTPTPTPTETETATATATETSDTESETSTASEIARDNDAEGADFFAAAAGESASPSATPPPSQPPPLLRRDTPPPAGLLSLIPDEVKTPPRPDPSAAPVPLPAPSFDPTRSGTFTTSGTFNGTTAEAESREAEEAARTYEHELRQKLLAQQAARPSFLRRHRLALAALALLAVVGAGSAAFLLARAHRRAEEARVSAGDARKGLARDTAGALRAASHVLAIVQSRSDVAPEADALAAEVDGLLAYDFGDAEARARARELLAAGRAGAGAPAASFLVAERDGDRAAATEALLAHAGPPAATPLSLALAGELLLARHAADGARPLLERAARAQPPMLRAVAMLGDLEAQRGELGAAVDRYEAVLRVHATHPHAALGLAEARLRQGRDLPRALASLEAVEADRDSPPALRDRLRFDLALARLLAAAGRTNDAVKRLTEAAAREPADPRVSAAQAEVLARAGELDRAIRAAEGAVRLAPTDPSYRELLARLQLRRGLYRELLAGTADAPTRTLRLDRGIARLALGEPEAALAELEATRRDGKTTAEAAAWMALADLASGRREQASSIVAALLASPSPHPVALLARARLDLSEGHLAAAEQRLRAAIDRDPELTDARCELGIVLRARNRLTESREVLEQAVARDPHHVPSRIELGRTRLMVGDAAGAVRELTSALAERPDDRDGLVVLSQAELASGHPEEARRAGEHAVKVAPRSGAAALAAGQAAAAQGDTASARRYLTRAAALLGKSREGLEARRALAGLRKKR